MPKTAVSSDQTAQSHDLCLLTHYLTGPGLFKTTSGLLPARQPQPEPLEASHTGRTPSNTQAKELIARVHAGGLFKGHTCLKHGPVQAVYSVFSLGIGTKNHFFRVICLASSHRYVLLRKFRVSTSPQKHTNPLGVRKRMHAVPPFFVHNPQDVPSLETMHVRVAMCY